MAGGSSSMWRSSSPRSAATCWSRWPWSIATTRLPNSGIYRRQERLLWHQAESGPVMEDLHAWLARQLDEHRVEPNSTLGKAMAYLLRHWTKLTLFLRVPGAPLDNNICEQALKKAIRHRRNSLFYKTHHGAHVGDVFMSLIHTCELCGSNPFDYLTELERHADRCGHEPAELAAVELPRNAGKDERCPNAE